MAQRGTPDSAGAATLRQGDVEEESAERRRKRGRRVLVVVVFAHSHPERVFALSAVRLMATMTVEKLRDTLEDEMVDIRNVVSMLLQYCDDDERLRYCLRRLIADRDETNEFFDTLKQVLSVLVDAFRALISSVEQCHLGLCPQFQLSRIRLPVPNVWR
jgi:hypothetical protein